MDPDNFPGGWKPRPPDDRDFRARAFLASHTAATVDQLLALNKKVQRSWLNTNDLKHWVDAATSLIVASAPVGPPPPPPVPPAPSPAPTSKLWRASAVLDQDDPVNTPHCVGFAGAGFLLDEPVEDPGITNATGHTLYYKCKEIDGEPGAENGSNVRSMAKVLKNQARIGAYAFASSVADIRDWLLTKGVVQWGSVFLDGMFDLNPSGFMVPTGNEVGGHSWMWIGYDAASDVLTGQNSWGTGWGSGGFLKMHGEDAEKLWARDAEAMMTLELPLAA
jgi:hypothetical protein